MSAKPIVQIKRQGNSLTVFVDAQNNTLLPYPAWGAEPIGGFPYTAAADELVDRVREDLKIDLRNYEWQYIDPPARRRPAPLQYSSDVEQTADKQWKKFVQEQAATERVGASTGEFDLLQQILTAFREIPEEDVEPVGSFLINLVPEIEPHLRAARQPQVRLPRRFKL